MCCFTFLWNNISRWFFNQHLFFLCCKFFLGDAKRTPMWCCDICPWDIYTGEPEERCSSANIPRENVAARYCCSLSISAREFEILEKQTFLEYLPELPNVSEHVGVLLTTLWNKLVYLAWIVVSKNRIIHIHLICHPEPKLYGQRHILKKSFLKEDTVQFIYCNSYQWMYCNALVKNMRLVSNGTKHTSLKV